MVDLSVDLCGMKMDNPVMTSSGTCGFGYLYADFYDINILGSVCLKGTTRNDRFGNPTPRIAECNDGMINCIGLQNPGVDRVIAEELPKLEKVFHKKAIANVCGFETDEYVEVAEKFDADDRIGILEINISCPNVKNGGLALGTNPKLAGEVVNAVKKAVKKPIIVKLSPNVTDITEIAKAVEANGADGVSLINSLLGLRINLNTKKPILSNKKGGFSGRAVFPVALRMVYDVYDAVKIPIVGLGGISSAENVIEMMLAGATAVAIGAENLVNPYASKQIIENLPETMEKYKITKLKDIIGMAHN